MTTRPPFQYFGGKTLLAKRIVAEFPEHRQYVEPFAGSLAVLLAKDPAPMETVNDLDGDLMTFWRVLRERPEELQRACQLTPHSRSEHELSRDLGAHLDDLERARRVWVALAQGRGAVRRTGWRHYLKPAGNFGMPAYLDAYVDRMAPAVERLHHVSLECQPALRIIERYGRNAETLLYVDPPYLGSTRGSQDDQSRAGTHRYVHEMLRPAEHEELLDALTSCAAAVVLSGYASELYAQRLPDRSPVVQPPQRRS
jgi:DNA adenine methylase